MKTSTKSFPHARQDSGLGVAAAFPKGSVVTLFAQVAAIKDGWARRVRLQLSSSLGDLGVEAHLDLLPDKLEPGDWVRLQAMRRHGEGETVLTALSVKLAFPDCKVAWLPGASCHRAAHMARLRRLLDELDPGLQLVFMLALADAPLQRRFFWRVAAADHHGYPGGLFDQSVEAAEHAWADRDQDPKVRGLAAMAALLFELGKTVDERLTEDGPRQDEAVLAPHPFTARSLARAFERAWHLAPEATDDLEAVIFPPPAALPVDLQRAARLAREAVLRTWQTRPAR